MTMMPCAKLRDLPAPITVYRHWDLFLAVGVVELRAGKNCKILDGDDNPTITKMGFTGNT